MIDKDKVGQKVKTEQKGVGTSGTKREKDQKENEGVESTEARKKG